MRQPLDLFSQVALGFIAFTIGNEFRLEQLRSMGRQAITVGILQAVVTTIVVDIALLTLHFIRPELISVSSAITLGAIASATAPAATLMVVRQYKADGPMTKLLLLVVAIDDAVGLMLFSASFGVASALESGSVSMTTVLVEPVVEILLSLGLGVLAGVVLNWVEKYFHSRSKRLSISIAFVLLTVGLSMTEFIVGGIHCGFSLLLVCMMTGTLFCNICDFSEELMARVDSWTAPCLCCFSFSPGRNWISRSLQSSGIAWWASYISFSAPRASMWVPTAAAPSPAAVRASKSTWVSRCCPRQVWPWAWL